MKIAFEFDEREFSTVMAGLRKLTIDEGMALFMRLNLEAREKAQAAAPAHSGSALPSPTSMN